MAFGSAKRCRAAPPPSSRRDTNRVVASTCPCTQCPPSAVDGVAADSRSTRAHLMARPSWVREIVSATKSTANPWLWRSTTARQAPLGETAAHQRPRDVRPGLAHHRIHGMLAKPAHDRTEVAPAIRARGGYEQHSGLAKLVRAANVGVTGHEDHGALRIPSAY